MRKLVKMNPFIRSLIPFSAACAVVGTQGPVHAILYNYTFTGEGGTGDTLTWTAQPTNSGVTYTGSVSGFFVWDTTTNSVVDSSINTTVSANGTPLVFTFTPNITLQEQPANSYYSIRIGFSGTADNTLIPSCNAVGNDCNFLQLNFDDNLDNPVLENGSNPGYKDATLFQNQVGSTNYPSFYCFSPSSGAGNQFCATSGQAPISVSISGGLNGTLVPSPFSLFAILPLGIAAKARKRYKFFSSKY